MVDHKAPRSKARQPLAALAALLGLCLLAAALLLSKWSAPSTNSSAEQVLELLQQLQADVKAGRDAADARLEATTAQLLQLQSSLDARVKQLARLEESAKNVDGGKTEQGGPAARRRLTDKLSEQPATAVAHLDSEGQYLASPSLVKLPGGRLLAAAERAVTWAASEETTMKLVHASDDGGATWQQVATVGPMNWPQLISCASGVYLIGTERHFSPDNNLVISKMLDQKGVRWSAPTKLTQGLSVVSANTGVDVSLGRVTKTFELIPSMAQPVAQTRLTQAVQVSVQGGVHGATWEHPPLLELPVASTEGFVQYTLVKVPFKDKALFFRIVGLDAERGVITARLERFNLFWQAEPATLPANSTLTVGSGAHIYGGVDWVASAMSADETKDLRDPKAWVLCAGLGNPASLHSNEMRALFDAAFRGDASVRKSIIGFDVPGLDTSRAWEAGFGSLYWMEGVATRLRDKHGGSNRLLSIMRVNNDMLCDLAALVELDDSSLLAPANGSRPEGSGRLAARFLRFAFVPGLGVGHPAILYDEKSDLYWMTTNLNRDATRSWKPPDTPSGATPQLHITAFSKCEVDRSTLALYYSSNLVSWVMAGMVDYHISLGRHFAYPHMLIDGADLLVVTRAAFAPWSPDPEAPLNPFYNNHNSNSIAFHRVKHFRQYANTEWVRYQGPYSQFPRRTAMKDEVESAEGKAFVEGVAAAQKAADKASAADAAARQQSGKHGRQP